MSERKPGWRGIPQGAVCWKPAVEYKTGSWKTLKPVLDEAKCTKCLLCWVYCPEGAWKWDGKNVTVDLDFCKGCGICEKECTPGAITMVSE